MNEANREWLVRPDPNRPSFDALGGNLGTRSRCFNEALAEQSDLMSASELGRRAQVIADECGLVYRQDASFTPQVTRSYMIVLRERGLVEQVSKLWRLTQAGRDRIESGTVGRRDKIPLIPSARGPAIDKVRVVDFKGRLLLPTKYAGATVLIEEVGPNSVLIRAVKVVPMDEKYVAPPAQRQEEAETVTAENENN